MQKLDISIPFGNNHGFPHSSVGKESACNAGDPGVIPGSGRSPGEGIGYPVQYSWASLVAQLVKNSPAMRQTWVRSVGWEDPLEKGKATHSSIPASRIPWTSWWGHKESDTTEWLTLSLFTWNNQLRTWTFKETPQDPSHHHHWRLNLKKNFSVSPKPLVFTSLLFKFVIGFPSVIVAVVEREGNVYLISVKWQDMLFKIPLQKWLK